MNYKLYISIIILLFAIFLVPYLQKYEMFCPCSQKNTSNNEDFCGTSSCSENFSNNANSSNIGIESIGNMNNMHRTN